MTEVRLAYYRKEDWNRFLMIIADRKSMHDSWDEWLDAFENAKLDLITQGYTVIDIVMDLDELIEYCKLKGIKNDGKARSQFVQTKNVSLI